MNGRYTMTSFRDDVLKDMDDGKSSQDDELVI